MSLRRPALLPPSPFSPLHTHALPSFPSPSHMIAPLPLPARELEPPLADARVVPLGHPQDGLVDAGLPVFVIIHGYTHTHTHRGSACTIFPPNQRTHAPTHAFFRRHKTFVKSEKRSHGRRLHLLAAGRQIAVGNVVEDAVVEEQRVLHRGGSFHMCVSCINATWHNRQDRKRGVCVFSLSLSLHSILHPPSLSTTDRRPHI